MDTLFNPAPESQVRAPCTDRPIKSDFPCTVDAGYFQYEADASNVRQDSLYFAVTWLALPSLQLDIGLNAATANWESYVGISQRF